MQPGSGGGDGALSVGEHGLIVVLVLGQRPGGTVDVRWQRQRAGLSQRGRERVADGVERQCHAPIRVAGAHLGCEFVRSIEGQRIAYP